MAKEDKKEIEVKDDDILDQEDGTESDSDEDSEDDEDNSKKEMKESFLEIFKDVDLSEEVKDKMATLFEAAIALNVQEISKELEAKYEGLAESYVEERIEEISESVSSYMDYATDQWVNENQLAIESGVRQEIMESFVDDMKLVFEKHNIELPADKVDLYEEAQSTISELESKVAELTESIIEQKAIILEAAKKDVARELAEDMVDTQKDKFAQLLEDVDASSVEAFREKAQYIKESFFKDVKPTETKEVKETIVESSAPSSRKKYAAFISESSKKE